MQLFPVSGRSWRYLDEKGGKLTGETLGKPHARKSLDYQTCSYIKNLLPDVYMYV